MNFCKFYNKAMNYLESNMEKIPPLNKSAESRENVKEINIIIGMSYIIFLSILFISIYILYFPFKIIYNLTTSKCEIMEENT